jgi:hypothetical protein
MKSSVVRLVLLGLFVLIAAGVIGFVVYEKLRAPTLLNGTQPDKIQAQPANLPVKIKIDREGIYRINLDEIGLAEPSRSGDTLSGLILTNNGQKQPAWFDERSNSLEFYGRPGESRYTDDNIYWLSLAADDDSNPDHPATNLQLEPDQTESPAASEIDLAVFPTDSFAAQLRLEENQVYNPLATDGDRWFWALLPAPVKKEYGFELKNIVPGPGRLWLRVWGSTDAPSSPDHHLRIRINSAAIVDDAWDGKGEYLIAADIPANTLVEGQNQLEIELPGDSGAAADLIYLDWIELTYPNPWIANGDELSFVSPGGSVSIQGFSGLAAIYDITDPENVMRVAESADPATDFASQAGHRYFVVGPQGYRQPKAIERPDGAIDLLATENAYDYVAIGPPDLLAPLQPLLALREAQGIKTLAVPLHAIYDQFSYGQADPQAIRSFLAYAGQRWSQAPEYLALVGDASYDPKGYITAPEANRTPTFFVQTIHGGETASDYGFSVPGDAPWRPGEDGGQNLPEVAVGRIPARTPEQVSAYVQKVISFEQREGTDSEFDDWQNRVLAIADGSEDYFRMDAQNFLNKFTGDYPAELLAPSNGEQGINQTIIQKINQGVGLAAYFGHGSINLWGKDRLFSTEDVPNLDNQDKLPIILNFTCLAGLFTHPKVESLAEAFLWQPTGGAIAVLAPTSLTLTEDQAYLSDAIADELVDNPGGRLGDLLTKARRRVLSENPSDTDVLFTFLLFGDPAIKLAGPVTP